MVGRAYEKGKRTKTLERYRRGEVRGPRGRDTLDAHHSEPAHPASKGSLGEGVLGLSSSDLLLSAGLVEFHELGEIELGLLQHLDLLDEDVFKGEDLRALLGDLLGNGVGQAAIKC